MAKYKMKSLSMSIKGRVFRKSEKIIFDTEKKHKSIKSELETAEKNGFVEKIKTDSGKKIDSEKKTDSGNKSDSEKKKQK